VLRAGVLGAMSTEGSFRARDVFAEMGRHWSRALITFLVGAIVLTAIRYPQVEQSFLGEPDRDMRSSAFKLRTDVFVGKGDPVLLIDIDNDALLEDQRRPITPGRELPASASRGMIADLLEYVLAAPPDRTPKAVMLDVDIAAPAAGDEAGVRHLHDVIERWAKDPNAPNLMISREAFPPKLVGLPGDVLALPESDFDDVIDVAPNIFWGEVRVLADKEDVVKEMLPYQCVIKRGRIEPLYASAILTYATLEHGKIPAGSPVKQWLQEAGPHCQKEPAKQLDHGGRINFHLSLERNGGTPNWPDLHPDWPGFRQCGPTPDHAVFRQIPAAAVQAAGADASHDLLCQRLVVIGGTNDIASDFQQTPLDSMAGAMILTNSVRGLQISKGGVRQAPLPIQLAVLGVISILITTGFTISRLARRRYLRHRAGATHWRRRLALLPLNPIVLNWSIAFLAHWIGVGLLIWSLELGYWGFLSGPAFGAAMAEAIQDFTDESK
jgi:CHASE2 domain-containing sensor protein